MGKWIALLLLLTIVIAVVIKIAIGFLIGPGALVLAAVITVTVFLKTR
jgi:hypothetical protein